LHGLAGPFAGTGGGIEVINPVAYLAQAGQAKNPEFGGILALLEGLSSKTRFWLLAPSF
jgi:hypothetical protein